MYGNKVEICGVNTARLPVLGEGSKNELLRRAHSGDRTARQELIRGNLRLVLSVVQRFSGRGQSMDDLFQVGCIGLIKAIDNFNPDLEVRFSTYGVPMIMGEVKRFLRDNNPLRVSRSLRDVAYKAMQAREILQKKLGHDPTLHEISEEISFPEETVAIALESSIGPVSLYEPAFSDGEDSLYVMDQVSGCAGEESWISGIMFRQAMQEITGRERRIIVLRYLEGKTQMQVAHEIGISQAQVSRLEKNALVRIKAQIAE